MGSFGMKMHGRKPCLRPEGFKMEASRRREGRRAELQCLAWQSLQGPGPGPRRALPSPVPHAGTDRKDPNGSSGKAKQARGELARAGEGGESVQGRGGHGRGLR